jgi:hypothetical protein
MTVTGNSGVLFESEPEPLLIRFAGVRFAERLSRSLYLIGFGA